jgi:hypothetical protein
VHYTLQGGIDFVYRFLFRQQFLAPTLPEKTLDGQKFSRPAIATDLSSLKCGLVRSTDSSFAIGREHNEAG